MKEYVLHDVLPEDTALSEYIKLDSSIEDVKLVHSPGARAGNTWTAIAIRFKSRKQDILLNKIVALRADEYWGKKSGYHVFWWD